jgi:hypothetical protein
MVIPLLILADMYSLCKSCYFLALPGPGLYVLLLTFLGLALIAAICVHMVYVGYLFGFWIYDVRYMFSLSFSTLSRFVMLKQWKP